MIYVLEEYAIISCLMAVYAFSNDNAVRASVERSFWNAIFVYQIVTLLPFIKSTIHITKTTKPTEIIFIYLLDCDVLHDSCAVFP